MTVQLVVDCTTHVFVFADCITHRHSTQHDADCTTLVRSCRSYDMTLSTTSLNTVRCRSHDTICTSDHDALVVATDRVVCPSAQLVAVRTTHVLLVQIVSCVRPTCRRLHDTLGCSCRLHPSTRFVADHTTARRVVTIMYCQS